MNTAFRKETRQRCGKVSEKPVLAHVINAESLPATLAITVTTLAVIERW